VPSGTLSFFHLGEHKMTAHEFLTNEGNYTHTHVDADFDDGDPENGPNGGGCDEYDLYQGDSHDIILQYGILVDQILINWDEYRYFEGFAT
jgi:hypothetical protein